MTTLGWNPWACDVSATPLAWSSLRRNGRWSAWLRSGLSLGHSVNSVRQVPVACDIAVCVKHTQGFLLTLFWRFWCWSWLLGDEKELEVPQPRVLFIAITVLLCKLGVEAGLVYQPLHVGLPLFALPYLLPQFLVLFLRDENVPLKLFHSVTESLQLAMQWRVDGVKQAYSECHGLLVQTHDCPCDRQCPCQNPSCVFPRQCSRRHVTVNIVLFFQFFKMRQNCRFTQSLMMSLLSSGLLLFRLW